MVSMNPLYPCVGYIRYCDFCHCAETEDMVAISGEYPLRPMFLLPNGTVVCANCIVLGQHEQIAAA